MGSKLRKLRAQAAAAGERYQAELRANARKVDRARRLAEEERASAHFKDAPFGNGRGPAAAASGVSAFAAHQARIEELRIQVAHILGSHDGAAELADAIHAGAVARAQASAHPNHEVIEDVWEHALAELRLGTDPSDLTALRSPVAEGARGTADLAPDPAAPVLVGKPDTRPPAAGMSIARRLPLLAQVAMISMMLAGSEQPRGKR